MAIRGMGHNKEGNIAVILSKEIDASEVTVPEIQVKTVLLETLKSDYQREISQRSDRESASARLNAIAIACRRELAARWAITQQQDKKRMGTRRVHYLSMEFLMGRALNNAIAALKLEDFWLKEIDKEGAGLAQILECEPDAALGNGGLGRLAACFLDSMATLGLPSFGYGLRYENGMFAQRIQDGRQIEVPDEWLRDGNPWEQLRHEVRYVVGLGGNVDNDGGLRRWNPARRIVAQAFDFVVPGHKTKRVSTLRQWHAQAEQPIDLASFCRGEYAASGAHRQAADTINWVLYPDDSTNAGRRLRLTQEYFLVSASLQDMLARHLRECQDIGAFGRMNAVHLNDTHPALAPAELMRLLIDEHGVEWSEAWAITQRSMSYTNHTLMPEALETWPISMIQELLPRHLEIVYEINRRFLDHVRAKFPGHEELVRRVSLIDESGERRVRMASLAIVASNKVNGVSALHSDLMVKTIFADYALIWPERFTNITNGVTHRRWLMQANPGLSKLIDSQIGTGWHSDLSGLGKLAAKSTQKRLSDEFLKTKHENKKLLAEYIRRELGISVDPSSLFDVQIKRIHEYKRQLLNVLHVVARYYDIINNPDADWVPRTVIFAGKAASAYQTARLVIQLIHDVAKTVNSDQRVRDLLKIVFIPNYGVSIAERIIPAADLSEQLSTAGTEASGTGNMKFGLNGALTIGTWDGANIEMAEAMGVENMFVFGLRAEEVITMKSLGYDPRLYVEQNRKLAGVIHAIASGKFSPAEPMRYRNLMESLLGRDSYMLMADFADYVSCQEKVDSLFRTPSQWAACALKNIAAMGEFSSDRTIQEYADKIWQNDATL